MGKERDSCILLNGALTLFFAYWDAWMADLRLVLAGLDMDMDRLDGVDIYLNLYCFFHAVFFC
jgi:hypothetical protein